MDGKQSLYDFLYTPLFFHAAQRAQILYGARRCHEQRLREANPHLNQPLTPAAPAGSGIFDLSERILLTESLLIPAIFNPGGYIGAHHPPSPANRNVHITN